MRKFALAAAAPVAAAALLATAAPAHATIAPTVTAIAATAKLQAGGAYVGLRISYRCDPSSTSRDMYVTFSQNIGGRIYRASDYFAPRFCTGAIQTSSVKVFADSGEPAWRTGPAVATARLYTYTDGSYLTSNNKTKNVRVIR